MQVNKRVMFAFCSLLLRKRWCLQVIEIPEDKRMTVFNSGTFMGSKASILLGGHDCPISIQGLTLEWK